MYVGIDLGTSAVKAIVVDEQQSIVASAEQALQPSRPQSLWSEDDPEAWWSAAARALDRLASSNRDAMSRVSGIGLSGQMHGLVALDEEDAPVRPAILWNDGRSYREAAEVAERHPEFANITGAQPMPGFTGPKVLWLRRNEPNITAKIRSVMLPKDFLRLKLCGERATDVSDAAGTAFFDQATRDWAPDAVDAYGVDPAWLVKTHESTDSTGQIRPLLAKRWGIAKSAVIAGGGGDGATGGIGIGAVAEGDAFISLGTSAQFFVAASGYRPAPAQVLQAYCHAVPQKWYQMAVMLSGASVVAETTKWLRFPSVDALLTEVEAEFRGPSELIFLPYLSGERTPHNDPFARGVLFGLSAGTRATDIALAALEGVAFMLADALDALRKAKTSIRQVGLIGGGARSAFWTRLVASVLDLPIIRYETSNFGPAYGAARLGRLAATGEPIGNVVTAPSGQSVVMPEPHLARQYEERKSAFRRLYQGLKPHFQPRNAEAAV